MIVHRILIVHAHKSGRDGSLSRQFAVRLDKAAELANSGQFDAMIISGGRTRRGAEIEARQGEQYVRGKCTVPILREEQSKTTYENVVQVKALVTGQPIEQAVVVVGQHQLKRTKYLYARYWPEVAARIEFIGVNEPDPQYTPALELLYRITARLDPRERVTGWLMKKLWRNG